MKGAVIAESDRKIEEELSRHLAAAGLEVERAGADDLPACLERLSGPDLLLVMVQTGLPRFAESVELARTKAPNAIVVAMADIDQKAALNEAIVRSLVDDFLPIPFSPPDIQGILKLLRGAL